MKTMNKQIALKVLLLSISLFSLVTPVFAEGVGEKVGKSLQTNIEALIAPVLLAVGIFFLVKRDWMKMASFVAIAIVVFIFINKNNVSQIANKIFTAFIGG
jgi:hypothetical protein